MIQKSIKLKYLNNIDNVDKEKRADIYTKNDFFLEINEKPFIENNNQKNNQFLFYNEKDFEEDKELLELFNINKDQNINQNNNSIYINF